MNKKLSTNNAAAKTQAKIGTMKIVFVTEDVWNPKKKIKEPMSFKKFQDEQGNIFDIDAIETLL